MEVGADGVGVEREEVEGEEEMDEAGRTGVFVEGTGVTEVEGVGDAIGGSIWNRLMEAEGTVIA